ncbi:ABC-2 family transporter protein [Paenibacillus sp. SC116]|uniref:ABC transporter permease n=1 Tax=Paenibacillus sp. SC116 TaxID=2968986 RepID=UPI00215AF70A|nr:ABC-2 family transporter protein [Paenibacillus sp. SC116]MCR8845582.1 ABC-2 family transporter protein [Paenibacillus sp. SC116]
MKNANKYAVTFRFGLQHALEYRSNFFLSLISAFVPAVVQYYIWSTVYKSYSDTTLFGYSYEQMIAYTILAAVVSKLVMTNMEHAVSNDIKTGGLNRYLIQPISYFGFRLCHYFGQKLLYIIGFIVIITLILFVSPASRHLEHEPERIVIFILSIVMAMVISFLLSFAVSAIAFWLADISYFFVVTSLVINIVSGGMFPLELFGEGFRSVISVLPFYYMIYWPVNVWTGIIPSSELWLGLLMQLGWSVVLGGVAYTSWKLGFKRYLGLGG